jgi:hypothetical protein
LNAVQNGNNFNECMKSMSEEPLFIVVGDDPRADLCPYPTRAQDNAERRAAALSRGAPLWNCRCVDCGTLILDTPIETETIACGSAFEHRQVRVPAPTPTPIENGRTIVLTSPARLGRREWTLIGSAPWRNRFGREVGVLTWQSSCKVCSAPFTATTSGIVTTGEQCAALRVVTCEAHRQRGKRA